MNMEYSRKGTIDSKSILTKSIKKSAQMERDQVREIFVKNQIFSNVAQVKSIR